MATCIYKNIAVRTFLRRPNMPRYTNSPRADVIIFCFLIRHGFIGYEPGWILKLNTLKLSYLVTIELGHVGFLPGTPPSHTHTQAPYRREYLCLARLICVCW